jgi:Fic family protein
MSASANRRLGRYLVKTYDREQVLAFVPPALPPDPPVRLDGLQLLLERANQALGRLDGVASILPDLSLFIYTYVRKEAVLPSQIEGTQSSLSDLLLFENDEIPGVPIPDVQEVSNYVAAMNHGLARMRSGFPLSLRLIRENHEILLSKGRGSEKQPGEFRRSQNWIGGLHPTRRQSLRYPEQFQSREVWGPLSIWSCPPKIVWTPVVPSASESERKHEPRWLTPGFGISP